MKCDGSRINSHNKISVPCFVLALQIALIPLIVRMHITYNAEVLSVWNSDVNYDFFSFFKSVLTICISVILLLMLITVMILKKQKIRKSFLVLSISVYVFLSIASAILSLYPKTAIVGFPERYEGLLVILAYMLLFISTLYFINNEKQVTFLLKALIISSTIIGIIGIFQYFGHDIFKSEFGLSWIVPGQYSTLVNQIQFQSEDRIAIGNAIYSSLQNPNTLGLYMSMIFPMCLFLFIQIDNKRHRMVLGFVTCLIFANLIGSFSRGAYIAAIIAVLVTGVLFINKLQSRWKFIIVILVPLVGIYIGMNSYSNSSLNLKIITLTNKAENHAEDVRIDKIKNFALNEDKLTVYCTNSVLNLSLVGGDLKITDNDFKELMLEMTGEKGEYIIKDTRYENYELTVIDSLIKIKKGKSFLYYTVSGNRFQFLNAKGEVSNITNIEAFGFENYERLGSGRGYIWSRTIPILKETLIFGTGPDTFAMAFPQNDFLGKLNYMYDAYIVIDKPHNMYLQTAVNTGLASLAVLISIFIAYIYKSIKILRKADEHDEYAMVGSAIFASIIAYISATIFTDSTISVSPIFWILLAIGFGVNKKIELNIVKTINGKPLNHQNKN